MRKSRGRSQPPLSATAVADLLPRLAQALRGQPVIAAYLFGSYGRLLKSEGTPGPLSDLDVAVLLAGPGTGPEPATNLASALYLQILGVLVDAAGRDDLDLVILNQAPPGLRFAVLRDGVAFLTGDPAVRRQFELAAIRTYQDLEPYRSQWQSAVRQRLQQGGPA